MASKTCLNWDWVLPSWTALLALVSTSQAIVMPDGHTGKLPTLGWNSWNAYQCSISEEKFLSNAQALVDKGLQKAGYSYVNIDDCWSNKAGRNATTGRIEPDYTKFPDGISGLADKVHNMSLNLGIYSTAGTMTCAGYPASLGHEDVDAQTFAEWGIDYLKYDNCNVPSNWTDKYVFCDPDEVRATGYNGTCNTMLEPNLAPPGYNWSTSNSAERFSRMRDALAKSGREILYSLCIWGTADVFEWGNDTAISWRMSSDIQPNWPAVLRIINENSFKMNSVNFWGHNDADMLEIGNGDLTYAESRSHFAFWAAMKSPLLIGTDLTKISQQNVDILTNSYLLAFSQDDVYGQPATPYKWGTNQNWFFDPSHPAEYWAGPSQAGYLVLILNPTNGPVTRDAVWAEIPGLEDCGHKVTNVWDGTVSAECAAGNVTISIESAHDTAVLLVDNACCS